jgi:DNA gyrase/topoisomerase IV subunit A
LKARKTQIDPVLVDFCRVRKRRKKPVSPIDAILTDDEFRRIASKKKAVTEAVFRIVVRGGKVVEIKPFDEYAKQTRFESLELLANDQVSVEEKTFYIRRRDLYNEDFPELNNSADAATLHEIIMCEIQQRRINQWMFRAQEQQKQTTASKEIAALNRQIKNLTDAMKLNQQHLNQARENLGVSRRERIKTGNAEGSHDVASIAAMFNDADYAVQLTERNENLRHEEDDEIKAKRDRDRELGIIDGEVDSLDAISELSEALETGEGNGQK